jgi:hypothetical protein
MRCCFSLPPLAVELMKPGSWVTLRNAKVDMFRGSMRLAVNLVGAVGGCVGSRRAGALRRLLVSWGVG